MTSSGPGQVLFAFVRHWARRPGVDAERGRIVLVLEAVDALTERGLPPTVNAVADAIGLDQSGVSRLMKDADVAGYLTVRSSASDGRRREAVVTARGHRMLDQAHRWQEQVFDDLTTGWSRARRQELHRAMTELMDRSYGAESSGSSSVR